MPQVIAAAASVISYVTAASAAAAAGTATLAQTLTVIGANVALAAGANIAAGLLQPNVSSSGQAITWTADPNAPLHFAAGRIGVAGQIVYRAAYGPNDRMYQSLISVVSAAGPIDGWESFKADDTTVTFDSNGKANSSYYANVMWRQTRLGTQPDTALTSPTGLEGGATLPGWGSNYMLSGKASYILTLAENSKRSAYSGREPQPLNVFRGLKVYDPRLDSTYPGGSGSHRLNNPATWTYSNNPILWGLKWSLGLWEDTTGKGAPQVGQQVGGIGAPIDSIDVTSFVEAANIADANDWTTAAWPSTDDDKAQVLDAFLQAGGAYYIERAGKIACLHRAAPRASVATISAQDTAGPLEIDTTASRIQRKNAIVPSIWSEADGWQITAIEEVTNATWVSEDGDRKRSEGVTFPYVTDANQAAQLACLQIAHTREGISGRIPLKPYMQGIEPGDCFTITEPGFVLDGQKFLCLETSYDAATGVHTVTFVSESDGKYPFALGQTQTPPAPPTLTPVDPTVVQPPGTGDWVVTVPGPAPDGTQFPTIDLTGYVSNENADAMLIAWRVVQEGEDPEVPPDFTDDDGVILPGWTDAGTFPPTTTQLNLTGMQPGSVIWLAIRYKRGSNVSLAQRVGPITVQTLIANPNDGSGDTTPPDVPTGLTVTSSSTTNTATGQPIIKIIATWDAVTADDLDHYDVEITQGGFTIVEWAGPDASPRFERPAVTGAVYTFRVRAVDASNNASDWTSPQNVTGAGDTVAPPAPTGLTVLPGLGSLRLSWTNASASDLAAVEIWENTTNNSGTATRLDTQLAAPGTVGGRSVPVTAGQTRYYWLKSKDTSGNVSGFSTGASGTAGSVQVTDFASTIAAPLLASSNADATTKAGGDSTGKFYLNTTDQKLYRGTGGSGWTKEADGNDLIAGSIVAGKIAAGAIGATEIAAGAITAGKIGANQVNATHIAAGSIVADAIAAGTITGDKLNVTTNLPATITVGTTGVSIGTVESRASDPAARVNANSTLIGAGKILLTGSTALSSWLLGSEQTQIDGGKIGANTVSANKLEIGARGLGFVGLDFTATNNVLSWSAGEVTYIDDAGVAQAASISSGSVTSTGRVYVYWQKGATALATGNLATATAPNRVIVCSFFGGANFTATYGRTIIEGPNIKTGAITADKVDVADLAALNATLGTVTSGLLKNAANTAGYNATLGVQIGFAGSLMYVNGSGSSGGFGASSDLLLWFGPTPSGASLTDPKLSTLTKSGANVYISTTAPRFGGSDVPTGPTTVDTSTFKYTEALFNTGTSTVGGWVDAGTVTLSGVASGSSASVVVSQMTAALSSGSNAQVQIRLVTPGGTVLAGPITRSVDLNDSNRVDDAGFTALPISGSSYSAKVQIAKGSAPGGTITLAGKIGLSAAAIANSGQAGYMSAQQAADLAGLVAGGGGGSGPALATTAPPAVGATGAAGTAATAARGDHTHALPAWLTVNDIRSGMTAGIGDVRMVGGDATHTGWLGFYDWNGTRRGYLGYGTDTGRLLVAADTGAGTPGWDFQQRPTVNGVNLALSTEVGGGGVSLSTTAPASVGSANAVGSGSTAARSDHVHAHGNQAGGSLHANASGSAAGFMSSAHYNLVNGATAGIVNNTLVLRTTYSGNAGSIQCADLLVQRSSGVGAIFFGSASDYIFQNGSAFIFTKGCQGPSFTPTSDLELKTNLTVDEDDEQALVAICQVARAEWDSTEDGVHRMGVVAQALAELDPRWVFGGEPLDPGGSPADLDGAVVDEDGVTLRRPYRVDPMAMLSSAFAAIRVLTNQNGMLESRLADIEAALAAQQT